MRAKGGGRYFMTDLLVGVIGGTRILSGAMNRKSTMSMLEGA